MCCYIQARIICSTLWLFLICYFFFFFNDTATTEIYTLSHTTLFRSLQLVHHGLHARAAHADAGADRVDRGVARDHADLGAGTGIAGHRLDLDDAVIDFRHLLREQFRHELRMGARQEDLRSAGFAADVENIGADAVAV